MNTSCRCFRRWLEGDESPHVDAVEQEAVAQHVLGCPDCRAAANAVAGQRAALLGAFGREGAPPPLTQALIQRMVEAMRRAASEDGPPPKSPSA